MVRLLLPLLALLLALPAAGEAQAGSCELFDNEYTQRRMEAGFSVIYIKGPLLVRCAGGAEIRAAEGTIYEATRQIVLVGQVRFEDPERQMTSQRATYASATGRLHATGNVVLTDRSDGSTLRGPELEYFRVMPNRPEAQMIATGRPQLTLEPRNQRPDADSGPVEVVADRMTRLGEDQLTATGRVEIRRTDLDATSAEARLDRVSERLTLLGNAEVKGERFELSGDHIDVSLPGDRLERVLARRDAELIGEDLRVDAPELQLFFADDLLQRLVALGNADAPSSPGRPPRPLATSATFRLEADSLEAILPDQRLEKVIAIGTARGESIDTVDTGAPAIAPPAEPPAGGRLAVDRDWIVGDTVTGFFALVEAEEPDAEGNRKEEVELQRIFAQGAAQSLYRVRNEDQPQNERPGLNFIVGDAIELQLQDGELELANVTGLKRGLYLDPAPPQANSPPEEPPPNQPPAASNRRPQRSRS